MVLLKSDGKLYGGCFGRFKKNYFILFNGWIIVCNIYGRLICIVYYKVVVGFRFILLVDYLFGVFNVFLFILKCRGRLFEV